MAFCWGTFSFHNVENWSPHRMAVLLRETQKEESSQQLSITSEH